MSDTDFQELDYETASNHEYRFKVKAVNVAPAKPSYLHGTMEDVTDVIVRVADVNEPPEFSKVPYSFSGEFLLYLRYFSNDSYTTEKGSTTSLDREI